MSALRLFAADWLLSVAGPPVRDGAVAVADGRVVWVGPRRDPGCPRGELRHLGRGTLLPGLVNAHCHLELSYLEGLAAPSAAAPCGPPATDDGTRFVDWVRALVARRRPPDDPRAQAALQAAVAALVAGGTAAVGDVSNTLASVPVLADSPLQAVVFHELIGWDPEQAAALVQAALGRLAALPADLQTRGVRVRLALHAPHSVSPALAAALQAQGGAAALHLAESVAEVRFLRDGDGPWPAFLAERGQGHVAFDPPGGSPVSYADNLGLLRPGLLAAHCVQCDRDDLALLARRGVGVVLCPRSNAALGVGRPPLAALLAAGVGVALGSDSLASAPTLNVLDDLRAVRRAFPDLPPERLTRLATCDGARLLGLPDCGVLAPGATAVLAFVPAEGPASEPYAALLDGQAPARGVSLEAD